MTPSQPYPLVKLMAQTSGGISLLNIFPARLSVSLDSCARPGERPPVSLFSRRSTWSSAVLYSPKRKSDGISPDRLFYAIELVMKEIRKEKRENLNELKRERYALVPVNQRRDEDVR